MGTQDDIYSNQLHDGCQDLAQRVLGVFPALQYESALQRRNMSIIIKIQILPACPAFPASFVPIKIGRSRTDQHLMLTQQHTHTRARARTHAFVREVRLLAQLLYHGVTTGAGLQTLGEEYCNMMQLRLTAAASSLCCARVQKARANECARACKGLIRCQKPVSKGTLDLRNSGSAWL
eukprot:1143482-Pelagomonas_calceolata.AAC.1